MNLATEAHEDGHRMMRNLLTETDLKQLDETRSKITLKQFRISRLEVPGPVKNDRTDH